MVKVPKETPWFKSQRLPNGSIPKHLHNATHTTRYGAADPTDHRFKRFGALKKQARATAVVNMPKGEGNELPYPTRARGAIISMTGFNTAKRKNVVKEQTDDTVTV
jgi:hypothetical protein